MGGRIRVGLMAHLLRLRSPRDRWLLTSRRLGSRTALSHVSVAPPAFHVCRRTDSFRPQRLMRRRSSRRRLRTSSKRSSPSTLPYPIIRRSKNSFSDPCFGPRCVLPVRSSQWRGFTLSSRAGRQDLRTSVRAGFGHRRPRFAAHRLGLQGDRPGPRLDPPVQYGKLAAGRAASRRTLFDDHKACVQSAKPGRS